MNRSILSIICAAAVVLLTAGTASAEDSGVPLPHPAKAFKGDQCVEPVDVIRRKHPDFLKHQRDETVKDGIRGKKYSLVDCVECHAVPDPEAGGARTVRTFCNECHKYAAVSIDCFQCHTTKAETAALKGPLPPNHPKQSAALGPWSLAAEITPALTKRSADDAR